LISYDSYDESGQATRLPFTVGQISYDAAGRMSAELMRDNRPTFKTNPAPEAERAAAYSSYIAYFGHYTIDADKRTVTHHVEGALSPAMVGTDLVRYFEFSPDGKSLFLSVKTGERVSGRLRWDRY
jgi:YD repeat-containing protein